LTNTNGQLVSKATKFLSVVVKMPHKAELFSNPAILEQFCEKIVLPNMALRPFEEELFEDDPLEYLRRDLEGSGWSTSSFVNHMA
jgi:exportin-2 (importin alpha re-exporter)